MAQTNCPECDAVIILDEPREGLIISCPDCGVDLEVIDTDPFEVDLPFDDDWDDDDWDDDDWDDDWDEE
ncbi:MAG: hypothetical protein DRI48_02130 [Chloroflexi bacterium]|nr:MAG: hypothetical protein DRI48_02130 [Chloroflexota bacterium]